MVIGLQVQSPRIPHKMGENGENGRKRARWESQNLAGTSLVPGTACCTFIVRHRPRTNVGTYLQR